MARKRGGLTPEESALWSHVASSVTPMHPKRREAKAIPTPNNGAAKPVARPAQTPPSGDPDWMTPFPRQDRQVGKSRFDPAPTPGERLAALPVRMDHKKHRQMTRGKIRPEARIDLHGKTLAEAFPALVGFIVSCHANGCRLVLVITGKGKPGSVDAPLPVRPGALRHNVPQWLHMSPLGALVQQVTPAHRTHGGDGAYYVYLRKS